jgi:hypothetical protein
MLKFVTCPELGREARIDAQPARRAHRERVLYCSLWDREEVVETCQESCIASIRARAKGRNQLV